MKGKRGRDDAKEKKEAAKAMAMALARARKQRKWVGEWRWMRRRRALRSTTDASGAISKCTTSNSSTAVSYACTDKKAGVRLPRSIKMPLQCILCVYSDPLHFGLLFDGCLLPSFLHG